MSRTKAIAINLAICFLGWAAPCVTRTCAEEPGPGNATLATITLADGSITSQFLEMFGRPARDTGLESERNNEPTDAQRLHLLNSSNIQHKIERSQRLQGLIKNTKGNRDALIRLIYMSILSRDPTQVELAAAKKYFQTDGLSLKQAQDDLAWALINTKEFLYRH